MEKAKRLELLFQTADRNLNCNTAYPVFKEEFKKYESTRDVMESVSGLSYYIHIPFCKHLCKFCEYTRFQAGDREQENKYIELLESQIREFLEGHDINRIYGLDIGGGTPSALDEENFEKVLKMSELLLSGGKDRSTRPETVSDFEKSIEISFSTINERKIELIGQYGFKRVSAGIQTMSRSLLEKHGRAYSSVREIESYMNMIHKYGVEKINLDLMYGMPGQTEDMLDGTLDVIRILKPEQVTLYEMRYNRMEKKPDTVDRKLQYYQYNKLFEGLCSLGYNGRYGKNTFTLCSDNGVSSYLWYRMDQGIPYKGFGISAQSMSLSGLSYGSLKNTDEHSLPELNEIGTSYNYNLPKEEIAAKYISIGMYNGRFRLDIISRILGNDARLYFADELHFLESREYITIRENYVEVTQRGFRYYGAIAALFWSESQKEQLLKME